MQCQAGWCLVCKNLLGEEVFIWAAASAIWDELYQHQPLISGDVDAHFRDKFPDLCEFLVTHKDVLKHCMRFENFKNRDILKGEEIDSIITDKLLELQQNSNIALKDSIITSLKIKHEVMSEVSEEENSMSEPIIFCLHRGYALAMAELMWMWYFEPRFGCQAHHFIFSSWEDAVTFCLQLHPQILHHTMYKWVKSEIKKEIIENFLQIENPSLTLLHKKKMKKEIRDAMIEMRIKMR